MSQMPCLLPSIDSDEQSLKRTHTSHRELKSTLPLPPHTLTPNWESQTVDVIQYVSDWLLFAKSVSPSYDQRLIKRNESLRGENQKNITLELYRGFTVTPHDTSILSLNYNDLNTDYTLGHWLWSTFRLPHTVLPISSGHSHKQTLSRDLTMQLRDTTSRSSKKA